METTRNFFEELDKITTEKWEKIYECLKDTTDIYSITFGVFPSVELLSEFGLNEKFNFSVTNENGQGKMNYFYKGLQVEPESYYLLPENYREVSTMEMFHECVRQDTHRPDIKHLQVDPNKIVEKTMPGSLSSKDEDLVSAPTTDGFDDDSLIGKTVDEAREICKQNNLSFRVTIKDGVAYIITMDLRFDRINVNVENGVITKVDRG